MHTLRTNPTDVHGHVHMICRGTYHPCKGHKPTHHLKRLSNSKFTYKFKDNTSSTKELKDNLEELNELNQAQKYLANLEIVKIIRIAKIILYYNSGKIYSTNLIHRN